jgi:hypothetical protein
MVVGFPKMQTKMVFAELALKHWYTILFGFRSYTVYVASMTLTIPPIAGLSLHILAFKVPAMNYTVFSSK